MQDRERIAGWDVHEWRDPVAEYKRRMWPGGKTLLEEVSYVAGDNLQILNIHGNAGPPPCAKTCVGTTNTAQTPWKQVSAGTGERMLRTTVDISGCKFAGTPIVTTSLHQMTGDPKLDYISALVTGQSAVAQLTKNSFQVYLYGFHGLLNPVLPFTANFGAFWDVHWTAFGYIC